MSSYMTSMARYSTNCPFLHRTSTATLRSLASTPSAASPHVSNLASKAIGVCPVMGPQIVNNMQSRGMAHVAGPKDVQEMHKPFNHPASGDPGKCPHAKAAAQAAAIASSEALAAKQRQAAARKTAASVQADSLTDSFPYSRFYESELDKKHKDKSYRYFNNINRLAAKFPVAHTKDTRDEVDVWCSNDYLGMSKNAVVLDTMK